MLYLNLKYHLGIVSFLLAACLSVRGQVARTPPATGPAANPQVVTEVSGSAPQVVMVVHRLSGIKLLRLLRSSDAQATNVASLDAGFAATKEMHTSFIAGLTFNDGHSIVAWLPRAEAEVEAPFWPVVQSTTPLAQRDVALPTMPSLPQMPAIGPTPALIAGPQSPDLADLMIVRRDGQKFAARYVGLDGLTGLSLLQVSDEKLPSPAREASEEKLAIGQRVRLLAPQRADQAGPQSPGTIYLRVGEIQGRLSEITRISSGRIARLKVRAPNLSAAIVGGVALNDAGETIGIVETSDTMEARIMPVEMVRRAAERVLARRTSVPRPWLGVSGDAVAAITKAQLIAMGWPQPEALALMDKRQGLLLTKVAPGTPAALANLRAGDIIMRVNNAEVKSTEDFTFMLNDAGGGVSVNFTLLRPDQIAPHDVSITLSEALNPKMAMDMSGTGAQARVMVDPLVAHGAETIALSPEAAERFGARGGLLIVFVNPESAAAHSGLRTGDVIESIDGQLLSNSSRTFVLSSSTTNYSLNVVRNRQRLEIKLQTQKP